MGRDSRLTLVSSRQRVQRATLQEYANAVRDESHWAEVLASAPSDESRAELERLIGPLLPFRRCLNASCDSGEPPTWLPVLTATAADGRTERLVIQRKVCPACKDQITRDDVLTDALWAVLQGSALVAGLGQLDPTTVTLTWELPQ